MCVGKPSGVSKGIPGPQPTEEAVEALIKLLSKLPATDRSSCALSMASRLIEYAAFESAGTYSAEDVADLINCAARIDYASADLQTVPPTQPLTRRLQ